MKRATVLPILLLGTSLFADITMCFKENHPSLTTIEDVPLNGGACEGKYSINDMKKKGWVIEDIKINGSNYVYILKTQDHGKTVAGVAPSGVSQEQMEANILAKLEAKQEAEAAAKIAKEAEEVSADARDIYISQCQNCHGEKGELNKGGTRLKDLSIADMEAAVKDYKLGTGDKASSIYGPTHINFLDDKRIKSIKAYLDSIQ